MTQRPRLEMLWEAVNPADAMTTRFGFADPSHAVAWLREVLQQAWGLRIDRCDRLVISANNLLAWLTADERSLIAKASVDPSSFRHLERVDALIAWLREEDIPVAAPFITTDGRLRIDQRGYSVALYPVIEGDLLDVDDAAQVAAAGRMLGRLHRALASYPGPFGDLAVPEGRQLVHGDFRSANILQRRGTITAVLDFDDASYQSRAAELAQSVVLLGTRYYDWQPTSPDARNLFTSAYIDVYPLTSEEQEEFDTAVLAVSEHFGWT